MLTHYELLGVEKDSSYEEIRKAYRTMSKKHHPDLNEGRGSALFSAVNEAYEILGDEAKRASYDEGLNGPSLDSSEGESHQEHSTGGEDHYASEQNYRAENTNPNVTHDTPGGVRQVKVNWSDYGWWGQERDEEPISIVNPHPHVFARFWIVLGYWIALCILGFFSLVWATTQQRADNPGLSILMFMLAPLGLAAAAFLQATSRDKIPVKSHILHSVWLAATIALLIIGPSDFNIFSIVTTLVVAALGVLSGIWGKKVESEKVWVSQKPILSKKDLGAYFQWGEAGKLDDMRGKFGDYNVDRGIAGEKYTEKLLQELYRIPSVRLFHGLKFPGSEKADVDHAILAGNTVIFIDSKQWSAGTYSFANELGVIEQAKQDDIVQRATNFNRAVNGYRWLMPERFTVYGVMLIHGVGVVIDKTADSQDGIRLMDTRDGMDVIGTECAKADNHIDYRVANLLANALK